MYSETEWSEYIAHNQEHLTMLQDAKVENVEQITQPQPYPTIDLTHKAICMIRRDEIFKLLKLPKFANFITQIDKVAKLRYPTNDDLFNKYKGDLFEIFGEFLIKFQGHSTHIGITAYGPMLAVDHGVDGVGTSLMNGLPATVQMKYRQYNHTIKWNDDHIANFYNQSRGGYFDPLGYLPKDSQNMLIITSAKEIHHSVDDFSYGKMRYIVADGLRELTDGMVGFWDAFRDALLAKQPQRVVNSPASKQLRQHQLQAVAYCLSLID